ncbi:uncharacterized isomerase PA2770-like [Tigriopus californicus]|uniref:uncharacterized isomerase PA2770-like n=1 Tax=Tigriopus californicus TaxID=6832 RepID=UPI0027DA3363|nr:uncharacterized isomerase PA2770-like [Tigriopus californicus]
MDRYHHQQGVHLETAEAMEVPLFHVDTFTDKIFGGNPTAVAFLEYWLEPLVLQQIAKQTNMPATVFIVGTEEEHVWRIRWFSPDFEIDLCGHGTLASAHAIFEMYPHLSSITMMSDISGVLEIEKPYPGLCQMTFPTRPPVKIELDEVPECILKGIGTLPKEIWKSRDYLFIYDTEEEVAALKPNQVILGEINLDPGGIVATAPATRSAGVDFVSRFFTPQSVIFEDPATGSSHCSLVPFWAQRLGKQQLTASQISDRGGKLTCFYRDQFVLLQGQAVTFMKGLVYLSLQANLI